MMASDSIIIGGSFIYYILVLIDLNWGFHTHPCLYALLLLYTLLLAYVGLTYLTNPIDIFLLVVD